MYRTAGQSAFPFISQWGQTSVGHASSALVFAAIAVVLPWDHRESGPR